MQYTASHLTPLIYILILFSDRAMAQAVNRWLLTSESQSVHLGIVVDKVALALVFVRVLRFSVSVSLHHGCPCSYSTWGMNNRPVCGRRSRT
jgi:hypothetical protein